MFSGQVVDIRNELHLDNLFRELGLEFLETMITRTMLVRLHTF